MSLPAAPADTAETEAGPAAEADEPGAGANPPEADLAATAATAGEAPVQFGKYRLQRLLARGGMGEVYLARLVGELGFEKPLVIKTILPKLAANPKFIELFAAEAKTAVALSHGNIVPTYELGRADETFYIVMGYVDGPSVAQMLQAQRRKEVPVNLGLALHVIRGVLAGLAYAHHEGPGRTAVVHRDITPRNVLIDRSGQVRIVDFGIAAPAKQQTGIRAGSIGYIAPEQARGASPDPRADVFSVGCLLYELCTRERAFPKEDVWVAPNLASLPEGLREVLAEALCLDPLGRPANGREMLQRLRPALNEHASTFEDPELASELKELFPHGWDAVSLGTAQGSAPLRAFGGENETFATRLTSIEPEDELAEAVASISLGEHSAPERHTLDDASDVSLTSARTSGEFSQPPSRLRTIGALLFGAAAIGGIAFAVGRSDTGVDVPQAPVTQPAVLAAPAAVPTTEGRHRANPPTQVDSARPPTAPASGSLGTSPDAKAALDPVGVDFRFVVEPADARVSLGEEQLDGGSPYAVNLVPDKIVLLSISKRGFVSKTLSVNPAQPLPKKYVLERARPREPGFLRISAAAVSWAEVRIDGKKVGTTPTPKLTVSAGRHRLEVVCIPDACPTTRTLLSKAIVVEPGKLERISAGQ